MMWGLEVKQPISQLDWVPIIIPTRKEVYFGVGGGGHNDVLLSSATF